MYKKIYEKPFSKELIPIAIVQLVFIIAALVSIIRKPLPWANKWGWLPLIFVNVFLPIGSIVYFLVGSRSLDKKAAMFLESDSKPDLESDY